MNPPTSSSQKYDEKRRRFSLLQLKGVDLPVCIDPYKRVRSGSAEAYRLCFFPPVSRRERSLERNLPTLPVVCWVLLESLNGLIEDEAAFTHPSRVAVWGVHTTETILIASLLTLVGINTVQVHIYLRVRGFFVVPLCPQLRQ